MNIKSYIVLICLILASLSSLAQSTVILEKGIDVIDGVAEIKYTIDKPGVIECRVSDNFGKTFSAPLKYVTGDIGSIKKGGLKSIKCDILSEFGESFASLIFRIIYYPSEKRVITVNNIPVTFIYVDGGTFDMGGTTEQIGANDQEKPVHRVTVGGFWMAETETTQELWNSIMGNNPSVEKMEDFPNQFVLYAASSFFYINQSSIRPTDEVLGYSKDMDTSKYPVNSVSYMECLDFIEKLKEETDLSFRLPTEAEWEFAARGGNKTKSYIYSGSNNLSKVAQDNHRNHSVKGKRANELGLYDMTGNVCELCLDSYNKYSEWPCINPLVCDDSNEIVVRGGIDFSRSYDDTEMRISKRLNFPKRFKSNIIGFRLILQ